MTTPKLLHFIETPIFTRRLEALGSKDLLHAIQENLLEDPRRWPVVSGTKGARKARIADGRGNKGKRGGFRFLYLYLETEDTIFLLFIYGKTEQSDLSGEQKKIIAQLITAIEDRR